MNELTQDEIKRLFHYDPEVGDFIRLVSNANRVKIGSIAGSPDSYGYMTIMIDSKKYKSHRLAFLYMTGKFPENGLQVDHINRVKSDNRFCNLRIVTSQENHKNRPVQINNKSGCVGVHWHKGKQKWISRIMNSGKSKHLGCFNNIDDAIAAREAANIKYNFHENHGKKNGNIFDD